MENELSREQLKNVNVLRHLSKHFELDLTIKLFGLTVVKFHWPPTSKNA